MDVLDLMETRLSSFTKTDRAIYERLKKYPEGFAHDSYEDITNVLGVSPSALTRFAKKLGFAGYAELQYQLALDLEQRTQRTDNDTTASVFGSFIVEAERTIDREALRDLAEHIVSAKTVHCLGFNLSGLSARFLWAGLQSQLQINAVNDSYDFSDKLYGVGDVLVIFSVASGEWYRSMLQRLRKREGGQPYIALVTMNEKHPLRRFCNNVITLPTAGKVSWTHTASLEVMIFTTFSDMLLEELHKIVD